MIPLGVHECPRIAKPIFRETPTSKMYMPSIAQQMSWTEMS